MAWGFGTWDANGVDNNTGLVKINSIGVLTVAASVTGSYAFTVPSGYKLDFLIQPGGSADGRRKITVSGSSVIISSASSDDYSTGTYPNYDTTLILVYVR